MFHLKDSNQYSLGNECEQCCCKPRNLKYSTETNLYLASEIWSIVFKTLKENTSTDYFLKKKNGKQIVHARFARNIYNILVLLKSQIQLLG